MASRERQEPRFAAFKNRPEKRHHYELFECLINHIDQLAGLMGMWTSSPGGAASNWRTYCWNLRSARGGCRKSRTIAMAMKNERKPAATRRMSGRAWMQHTSVQAKATLGKNQ